jgi:hypothetical protein
MKKIIVAILCFVILISCTKEEISPRFYPRVSTLNVDHINSDGALFHAEVTFASVKIIDHGFIWSRLSNLTLENAQKVSLGSKSEIGPFEASVGVNLAEGIKYYVKAYVKSEDHIVYGNAVEFKSLGGKAPVILDFAPDRARIQDTIKITGRYFGTNKSEVIIMFDGVSAPIVSSSDTLIIVRVPADLAKAKSKISVSVSGNIGYSPQDFELIGPEIKAVSTLFIKACDTLTIDGDNFAGNLALVRVHLNETVCKVISGSSKQLKILVPAVTPPKAEVVLKVTSSNIDQAFPQTFTYQIPSVDNVSSLTELTYNDAITFEGIFPVCEKLLIKVGGKEIEPTLSTANQLKIVVPLTLTSYESDIQISYGENAFVYQTNFSLAPATISSITPSTGTFNDIITITGKNFHPQSEGSEVYIGNAKGTITSASSTTIKVKVSPESAMCSNNGQCNKLELITAAGQSISLTNVFNLKRPVVNSVNQTVVSSGALFTINGDNFSPVSEYNVIKVGNKIFTPFSSSKTQLQFNMDRNALSNNSIYHSSTRDEDIQVIVSTSPSYDEVNGLVSTTLSTTISYKGPWTRRADFPGGARYNYMNFSIGDRGYVLLGTGSQFESYSDVWEYNTALNSWKKLSDFPGERRRGATAFSIGNYGYMGFGESDNGSLLKDMWRYDPISDTWTQLNDFPGMARWACYSFVIGNIAYVGGGHNYETGFDVTLKDIWSFNPSTNIWEQKNDPAEYVNRMTTFTDGVNGYVINDEKVHKYSPANNVWSRVNDFPADVVSNRANFSSTINNQGIVFDLGGDCYRFNSDLNTWVPLVSAPLSNNFVAFSANNKFYIGVGVYGGQFITEMWELDMNYYPNP